MFRPIRRMDDGEERSIWIDLNKDKKEASRQEGRREICIQEKKKGEMGQDRKDEGQGKSEEEGQTDGWTVLYKGMKGRHRQPT